MENQNEQIPLYNPLQTTLDVAILDDKNVEHHYTIPSHDMAYFQPHIAKIMEKHLIDAIINERELGLNEVYNEEYMAEIKKEIHVEL